VAGVTITPRRSGSEIVSTRSATSSGTPGSQRRTGRTRASARDALDAAETAAAAGDVATAERLVVRHIAHLWSVAGRFAISGLTCGDAEATRAANANLNVALDLHAEQVAVGFGSVWVSQKYGDSVVRVDPVSGAILATVEVGTDPLKLQPADGRMWVRTSDEFVGIDAVSNDIVATLRKADVGPEANRNFAVDGAMWICDGRRLHRYDPTTIQPVAVIDVDIPCDFVYATGDLVVAWNVNEDPGESGASAAAIVDPATDAVLARIDLPVDVVWPAVLDDAVFFGGQHNRSASIFVPTRGEQPWDVIVLDAETFEVVGTIEPLGVNGVAVGDGALWVTHPYANVLQRFDIER
jgi:hypothetical protein